MTASAIRLFAFVLACVPFPSDQPSSAHRRPCPADEGSIWHVEVTCVTREGPASRLTVTGGEFISYDAQFIELGRDEANRLVVWVRRRITKWTKTTFGREESGTCPMNICCAMLQDATTGPLDAGDWGKGEFGLLDLDPYFVPSTASGSMSVERVHPGSRGWYRCQLRREVATDSRDAAGRRIMWKASEPGRPIRDDWSTLILESTITTNSGIVSAIARVATEETNIPGLAETTRTESTLNAVRMAPDQGNWFMSTGPEDRAKACLAVRRVLERAAESQPRRDDPPTTPLLKEIGAWRRNAISWARTNEKEAGAEATLVNRCVGRPVGAPSGTWSDGRATSSLEGRRTVLVYWADWCGPCCAELRHYDSQRDTFARAGVELVGVNREKDVERQRRRLAALKLGFPSLLSADDMFTRFGIEGIPVTIMVAADGRIADVVYGFSKAGAARTLAWVTRDTK